ncbi:hypothetical protein RHGRI_018550 [Rhododendron griersonianum]|nr:hypothetical protein RHGRI_018550 [Rhododendron griersonianum]
MSDLCSPMIILIDDEADAFWCFERLMRRLRGNFRCTENSIGVEAQLSKLASITQVIDPKLHQHLETLGGGDYLFAFRMLMVLFRREFSFGDSLYLWEVFLEKKFMFRFSWGLALYENIGSGWRTCWGGTKKCHLPKLGNFIFTLPENKYEIPSSNQKTCTKCSTNDMKVQDCWCPPLMMWALEYDPDMFSVYEDPDSVTGKSEGSRGKAKSTRQCGKYERENMRSGAKDDVAPLPISVFLVAGVLKDRSTKLLTEARGLDDVVKILNDITGNLDAKKACTGAMKLHKKYLRKAKKT